MRFTEEEFEHLGYTLEEKGTQKGKKLTLSFELREPFEEVGYTVFRHHLTGPYTSHDYSRTGYWPFIVEETVIGPEDKKPERINLEASLLGDMDKTEYKAIYYEEDGKVVKTFEDNASLFEFLELGKMKVLSTKVPKTIGTNFLAMCKALHTSASERVRELVRKDLQAYYEREAKRLMFKEVVA